MSRSNTIWLDKKKWSDCVLPPGAKIESNARGAYSTLKASGDWRALLSLSYTDIAVVYTRTSMRYNLTSLTDTMIETGVTALERYLRQGYRSNKALAWHSQVKGIEKLTDGGSFVLCTPTGSGKTTIAELAILQSLFSDTPDEQNQFLIRNTASLAIYLVPFLGPLFLHRVSLVIIDEAHSVQFDAPIKKLQQADNRALRLETLGSRLFTYMEQNNGRVIALSAVATGIEKSLAGWVTGQKDSSPVKTSYRSVRQLIGSLECFPNHTFLRRCGVAFPVWRTLEASSNG